MFKNKKRIGLLLACSVFPISTSFAMEQNVTTCLTVNSNTSKYDFVAGFISTDYFDGGKLTTPIKLGNVCRSHTYKHGPKKLSFGVGNRLLSAKLTILIGKGCNGFANYGSQWVTNPNTKIFEKNVRVNFTLDQTGTFPGDYYTYTLNCEIHASN